MNDGLVDGLVDGLLGSLVDMLICWLVDVFIDVLCVDRCMGWWYLSVGGLIDCSVGVLVGVVSGRSVWHREWFCVWVNVKVVWLIDRLLG